MNVSNITSNDLSDLNNSDNLNELNNTQGTNKDIDILISSLDKEMKNFKNIISENSFDVENVINSIKKGKKKRI